MARLFANLVKEPSLTSKNGQLEFLRALLSEFLGTLLFVLISTATVTSGCHTADVTAQSGNGGDTSLTNVEAGSCFIGSTTALLNIALAFGFSLFVVIYFTASFSGGHINPAVSFAMLLAGKISIIRCIAYIIFQCSGAAVGSIILKGLDPSGYKAAGGASNQLNGDANISVGTGMGYEIVMTFVLVFVVFAATDGQRAVSTVPLPILAPLAIGMFVFSAHLVMIPIDGCGINPARSFGPAMVSRTFHHYWIWWAGPMAGAVLGTFIYQVGFRVWEAETPLQGSELAVDHLVAEPHKGRTMGDVEAGKPLSAQG